MSEESAQSSGATLREHLANERTLLAYVRTGVTLTSFGLTLNRFAVLLRQLHLRDDDESWAKPVAHLDRLGFAMGLLGVGLLVWSAFSFRAVQKAIDRGALRPRQTLVWVLVSLVILLSVAGLAILAFA